MAQLPSEIVEVYNRQGRKIVSAVSPKPGQWKVTTDSGRTVLWTRRDSVRPWSQKLLK
jgi:hypothetical protein